MIKKLIRILKQRIIKIKEGIEDVFLFILVFMYIIVLVGNQVKNTKGNKPKLD